MHVLLAQMKQPQFLVPDFLSGSICTADISTWMNCPVLATFEMRQIISSLKSQLAH